MQIKYLKKSATEGQISSHIILAYSLSNHKHNANVYKANIQKKNLFRIVEYVDRNFALTHCVLLTRSQI